MKLRILIVVDGNNKIGMGHAYRTLNLAHILKLYKHKTFFLTRTTPVKDLVSKNFKCFLIKNKLPKIKKIIQKIKPNIIVLDKLNENSDLLKFLEKNCNGLIGIDYTGKNKNLIKYGVNILYPKSGTNTKTSVSGFQYSILNNKFRRNKPIRIKKASKRVLVLQGGSDTHCFIPKIISALNLSKREIKITAVLGPSFNCWNKLKKAINDNQKSIQVLHNVKNMVSLMKKNDLAITAGGVTLLELCSLGTPSLVVCGEKFEIETASIIQRKGFGINLGYGMKLSKNKILHTTERLLDNYQIRKKMNKIGPRIVDGKGSERVAKLIEKLGSKK